jgi:hypothetical protein
MQDGGRIRGLEAAQLAADATGRTAAMTDRPPFGGLTEAEIDAIAERAAKKALQSVYAEVGQSVLKKLAWLIGLVVVGFALWLAGEKVLPLK